MKACRQVPVTTRAGGVPERLARVLCPKAYNPRPRVLAHSTSGAIPHVEPRAEPLLLTRAVEVFGDESDRAAKLGPRSPTTKKDVAGVRCAIGRREPRRLTRGPLADSAPGCLRTLDKLPREESAGKNLTLIGRSNPKSDHAP